MEWYWWLVISIWFIGFIAEMASLDKGLTARNIKYPSKALKIAVPLFMFFTWPYWYFYRKA